MPLSEAAQRALRKRETQAVSPAGVWDSTAQAKLEANAEAIREADAIEAVEELRRKEALTKALRAAEADERRRPRRRV